MNNTSLGTLPSKNQMQSSCSKSGTRAGADVIDVEFSEVLPRQFAWQIRLVQAIAALAILGFLVVTYNFIEHEIKMYRFWSYMQKKYPQKPLPTDFR
jgi:hypothetical protein